METPTDLLDKAITFGFVIGSLVLAWLIALAFGGWNFGKLFRQVELEMDRAQLPELMDLFHRRVSELGFEPTGTTGEFRQGGIELQRLGAFTHAKTPKVLTLRMDDLRQSRTRVALGLHYEDWIVADTGEVSYRDAVIDYVSGRSEEMRIIPNRSMLAVTSLTGGILSWLAWPILTAVGFSPVWERVLTLGITFFIIGCLAIIAIQGKRGQATGILWAVAGVITSASAIAAAILLKTGRL